MTMESILEKRGIKIEKMKTKIFNHYKLQILVTKASIFADHERIFLILIYKIFPKT